MACRLSPFRAQSAGRRWLRRRAARGRWTWKEAPARSPPRLHSSSLQSAIASCARIPGTRRTACAQAPVSHLREPRRGPQPALQQIGGAQASGTLRTPSPSAPRCSRTCRQAHGAGRSRRQPPRRNSRRILGAATRKAAAPRRPACRPAHRRCVSAVSVSVSGRVSFFPVRGSAGARRGGGEAGEGVVPGRYLPRYLRKKTTMTIPFCRPACLPTNSRATRQRCRRLAGTPSSIQFIAEHKTGRGELDGSVGSDEGARKNQWFTSWLHGRAGAAVARKRPRGRSRRRPPPLVPVRRGRRGDSRSDGAPRRGGPAPNGEGGLRSQFSM